MSDLTPMDPKKVASIIPIDKFFYRCHQCKDTGAMIAIRKSNPIGIYAFKCDCDRGRNRGLKYPTWKGDEAFEAVRS